MNLKIDRVVTNIIKYIYGFIFLIPLFYCDYFIYPAIFLKNIVFRILVSIAFVLYTFLIVKNKIVFKKSKIIILLGIFILVAFISSLINSGFYFSFFNSFERMEGIINYIYLFIFLLALIPLLKDKKNQSFFFNITLGTSFLISCYALLQKFQINFVVNSGADRIDSLLGNPGFLAGYLIFNIFIGLYLISISRKSKNLIKYIYLGVVFSEIIVLFLTKTRGAILAIVISFLIGLVLIIIKYWKDKKVRGLSLIFLLLILLTSFYYLSSSNLNSLFKGSSVQNRISAWKISGKAIQEKPVLGWGEGNFDIVFSKFYTTDSSEIFFDHAHNTILDIGVRTGILGILIYLGIFYYLFLILFKSYHSKKIDFFTFLIFSALLLAYLIHNFFLFDSINTLILFVLVLGFIIGLEKERSLGKIAQKIYWFFLIIFLMICIYGFFPFNIKPALANLELKKALENQDQDAYELVQHIEKGIKYQSFGNFDIAKRSAELYCKSHSNQLFNLMNRNNLFRISLNENLKQQLKNPEKLRPLLNLTMLHLCNYDGQNSLEKAEEYLLKARLIAPNKPEIHDFLGSVYVARHDWAKALREIEILLEFDDSFNNRLRKIIIDIYIGNIDSIDESLESFLLEKEKFVFLNYINLAQAFERKGFLFEAARFYELSLENSRGRSTNDVQKVYLKLIELYQKLGNEEKLKQFKNKV